MNRLHIKLIFLFSIFFITSCSYEPIFSKKNYNIRLDKISFSGAETVNTIIEKQLNLFKIVENNNQKTSQVEINNESKTYSINIFSELDKVIISKDTKGDPKTFEKTVNIILKVFYKGEMILSKELKDKYVYNNNVDKFELEQSEKIIVENLSQNITNSIISSIINIDDN